MTGEMLAFARFREGLKRYPGSHRLSFRDTGKGWVVTPLDGPRKARTWQEQQRALEQALLSSQLRAIARDV